jgi:alkanesulfonate monooxygenase SsuD/methylene tetrahydromethanopterin reductase-like flavin-dependent oxidoreductase (luciferase family)
VFGEQWRQVQAIAREAGRSPDALEPAVYLTLAIDDNAAKASQRIDDFLAGYYGRRPDLSKQRQGAFAGSAGAAAEWLNEYVREGARYFVLRFAGDHERHMETMTRVREKLEC